MSDDWVPFGKWFRQRRESLGLSPATLSRKSGVPRTKLLRLDRGNPTRLSLTEKQKLGRALGVSDLAEEFPTIMGEGKRKMEKTASIKDWLGAELEGVRSRLEVLKHSDANFASMAQLVRGEMDLLQQRESMLNGLLANYNGQAVTQPAPSATAPEKVTRRVKSAREKQTEALKASIFSVLKSSSTPLSIHDIRNALKAKGTRGLASVEKMRRGVYALIESGEVERGGDKTGLYQAVS